MGEGAQSVNAWVAFQPCFLAHAAIDYSRFLLVPSLCTRCLARLAVACRMLVPIAPSLDDVVSSICPRSWPGGPGRAFLSRVICQITHKRNASTGPTGHKRGQIEEPTSSSDGAISTSTRQATPEQARLLVQRDGTKRNAGLRKCAIFWERLEL